MLAGHGIDHGQQAIAGSTWLFEQGQREFQLARRFRGQPAARAGHPQARDSKVVRPVCDDRQVAAEPVDQPLDRRARAGIRR